MKYVVALWFAIFVCAVLAIGSLNWWGYYQLSRHGVRGQAVIIEVSAEKDGGVTYEYHVAGETFRDTRSSSSPSGQLHQGQQIDVYYNQEHAEESTLEDPKVLLRKETVAVCAGGLFISLFVTFAVASRIGATALGWSKIRKGPKTITLHSVLSPDECRARLAAAMDHESISSLCASGRTKPVLGTIRGEVFSLQKRRKYSDSFAPFFFGQFVASTDGTDIEGEFRIHPLAKLFMICWFSFGGVFTLSGLSNLAMSGSSDSLHQLIPALLISVGVVGFGVVLLRFSWWLARKEKGAIVEFLKSSLDAVVVSLPSVL